MNDFVLKNKAGLRTTLVLAVWSLLCATVSGCNRQSPEEPAFVPGLGEIMSLNQMRHIKLWFAGQNGNWALARYELDELDEGLKDAATFHPTHKDAELPIPELIEKMMKAPMQ